MNPDVVCQPCFLNCALLWIMFVVVALLRLKYQKLRNYLTINRFRWIRESYGDTIYVCFNFSLIFISLSLLEETHPIIAGSATSLLCPSCKLGYFDAFFSNSCVAHGRSMDCCYVKWHGRYLCICCVFCFECILNSLVTKRILNSDAPKVTSLFWK